MGVKCVCARKLIFEIKGLWVRTHVCVCEECNLKFTYHNLDAIRTRARHLERIGVGAIVSVAANAVNGAFTGGTAVDGTLHTGFISLSWLEKARWAGLKTEKDTYEN